MVIELTEEIFEKHLSDEKLPMLVMVYAVWDSCSRIMMPMFEEIAAELEGRAIIAKMDVYECDKACVKLGIKSVPTVIVFKNGAEIRREKVLLRKDQCLQLLAEAFMR